MCLSVCVAFACVTQKMCAIVCSICVCVHFLSFFHSLFLVFLLLFTQHFWFPVLTSPSLLPFLPLPPRSYLLFLPPGQIQCTHKPKEEKKTQTGSSFLFSTLAMPISHSSSSSSTLPSSPYFCFCCCYCHQHRYLLTFSFVCVRVGR